MLKSALQHTVSGHSRSGRNVVQATRHKILEILKTQSQATVSDLAEALQMAPVSVRHHLDVLQSQDLVTTQTVHKRTVGRPEQVYLLTSEANKHFPNNFQGLSAVVLDELKKHLTTAELQAMFHALAERTAQYAPRRATGQSDEEHLEEITDFLTANGYLAFWERSGDNLVLHTCNCPYAGVAELHPELCRMDTLLVAELTGQTPQCTSRLVNGTGRCTYWLTATEQSAAPRVQLDVQTADEARNST